MRITKNNLVWYFIRPEEELPASYVKHVKKFFKSIGEKNVASSEILRRDEKEAEGAGASSVKQQAGKEKVKMSIKRQATSDKRLSKTAIKIHEAWCIENGYLKPQATSVKLPGSRYKSSDYSKRATN
jgi:SET domain-containing protein